jgi:hypothetical protein
MLRLDTRLGPNIGDYDAVTLTQARLANDLSLFDAFMPTAPPRRQSPAPVSDAPATVEAEESLVFIHPPTATASSSTVIDPSATVTPRAGEHAQYAHPGRPSRQNSYSDSVSLASGDSGSPAVVESSVQYEARVRSISSSTASSGNAFNNADLSSFFPQAFYAYPAVANGEAPAANQQLQPNLGYVSRHITL